MTGPVIDDAPLGVPAATLRALLGPLSAAVVFVADRDLRVLACAGEPLRALGQDPASYAGRLLSDVLPRERWPALEPHYRAALDGVPQAFRTPAPSGRVYKVVALPVRPSGDAVEGIAVAAVDATTEDAVDRRLREAEGLLRAAFDAAAAAMVVFDATSADFGRIVQANGATARILGHPLETLAGMRLHDVLPPEEADRADAFLRRLAAAGEQATGIEEPLLDARGRRLWARINVSFVHDDGGAARLGVLQVEDVSREHLREEALRVSEERFGLVFDRAPVGMAVVDLRPGRRGRIVQANDAFAALVGRTARDLVGRDLDELRHPGDEVGVDELPAVAAGGRPFLRRYVRPDGAVRWASVTVGLATAADGAPRFAVSVAVDVTARRETEAAHTHIVEAALEAIVEVDRDGRVTLFNRAAEAMFGHPREAMLGEPLERLIPPEGRDAHRAGLRALRGGEGALVIDRREVRGLHADGSRFPVELSVHRSTRGDAEFVAFLRDISAQRQAERRSQGAEDLFRSMFEHAAVPMAVLTLDGLCLEANARMGAFLGRDPADLRGVHVDEVTHPDDRVPVDRLVAVLEEHGALEPRDKRFVRADGEVVWGHVQTTLLRDERGRPRGVQSQVLDITDQRRTSVRFGAVLESLAEGVVVLDGENRVERANAAALRLLGHPESELIGAPLHQTVHAHTAPEADCPILGVIASRTAVRVEDDTFRRADGTLLPVAYSAAPLAGSDERGVVVVFSDISERKAREHGLRRRLETLDQLERTRRALAEDRLVLYRQPILDLATREVVQEEILLRMRGEDGEIVAPGAFLPAAEEYGLIADIDRWVIGRSAALAAQGRHVEVNVSGRTLGHPGLTAWVEEALAASGADPRMLTFEITETALTSDLEEAARFAEHVAALGCGFALDDFGTGYGSFTLLKHLPVSYLKIDREFVATLLDAEADRHVVAAVVSLARGLGMRTIAEGVEEQRTLELLAEMGVDYAQGYLIGRPEPA